MHGCLQRPRLVGKSVTSACRLPLASPTFEGERARDRGRERESSLHASSKPRTGQGLAKDWPETQIRRRRGPVAVGGRGGRGGKRRRAGRCQGAIRLCEGIFSFSFLASFSPFSLCFFFFPPFLCGSQTAANPEIPCRRLSFCVLRPSSTYTAVLLFSPQT